MLDRESELYHSGILNDQRSEEHAAVVITRKGVEISATSKGLQLNYSSTWRDMIKSWEEIDQATRARTDQLQKRSVPLEN